MQTNKKAEDIKWAFFGSTKFSVIFLDELKSRGLIPKLVVTVPDKPQGRKLIMTPPEVKLWAERNSIPYIQPDKLKNTEIVGSIRKYSDLGFDCFIVFSYGKIIPKEILDIPVHGAINLHPSLLPKLRGPSPVKSAILLEKETGVTIIKMDEEMDHGPILAQKKIDVPEWPPYESDLENTLAHEGGKLLAEILPDYISGKIEEVEQNHAEATLCRKIEKTDGELNLNDRPEENLRKIRAYHVWPGAYFFDISKETKRRIIIKKAHIENNTLILDRVVPEGRKEMKYKDFLNGEKS